VKTFKEKAAHPEFFTEFIGLEEFFIFTPIGKQGNDPVKGSFRAVSAGKAGGNFRNKGPSAD
jgi:hypothetical protein